MEQPSGFVDSNNHVCNLQKTIYGLKQAPRTWFKKLSLTLLRLGFLESQVDHSLPTFHPTNVHLFLLIHVDDIIVTRNNYTAIINLSICLMNEFGMKDIGPLNFFLGINVTRTVEGIHLSQSKYISLLLDRSRTLGAKLAKTPLPTGAKLSQYDGDPLDNAIEYRHINVLQYCTITRPDKADIAFSVNQLYQFMRHPTTKCWRTVRYLKGSIDHGLFFGKGSLNLNAFSDFD